MVFQAIDRDTRFWAKVDKTESCWIWQGSLTNGGYGRFAVTTSETVVSHKWLWQQFNGPIPDGLQLDHLCRVRNCVNPKHLELVSPRTNSLRGIGPSATNARKTHCPKGHPYSPENTRITPVGGRVCRACIKVRKRPQRASALKGS